jgi:APA family basic amino acid/polyamine antiporter
MVGWALILEYAIAAGAVSVGWSGYMVGFIQSSLHIAIPLDFIRGPFDGGLVNLPAMAIAGVITWLLVIGTKESAMVNSVLVAVKIAALTMFVLLTLPLIRGSQFTHPAFAPLGFAGISGAAASIFFAFVGFDAVSTAAEETRNPQRNMPIGLIGSLAICTIFYILVAAGVIGTVGAQPVFGPGGQVLSPGTPALSHACEAIQENAVVCSKEALAWTLRQVGYPLVGYLVGAAAIVALPSVILMMMYGQTRIFFVMSRDGLLPEAFGKVHSRFHTPHVVTIITGVFVALFAAFFPVGLLADVSNSGTLFAFSAVSIAVMVLRRTDADRHRPFRTPAVGIVAPISILGCIYLFSSLSNATILLFVSWAVIGVVVYYSYSRGRSHVGRGLIETHESDEDIPPVPVPPIPG